MSFYRSFVNFIKARSPFKNFFAPKPEAEGGKKHPLDDYFKSMLSKTNLAAPPLDPKTALLILNIEKDGQASVEPKIILERFYVLYKKNDPKNGGTPYLQSKILAAKQFLFAQIPNAKQIEQQYYQQFIEPQEKAEEQENKRKQEEEKEEKEEQQKKAKQKQSEKEKERQKKKDSQKEQ